MLGFYFCYAICYTNIVNTRTVLVQARPPAVLPEGHQRAGAQVTQNRRGDRVWIGTTGKYYCGQHLLDCHCCTGQCGPTNGCNCANCMQLDVHSRHLPPGQLVNSIGRVSRGLLNGHFYCGRIFLQNNLLVGPEYVVEQKCSSEGPGASQCVSCKALEGARYASVQSDSTIADAGSPEDTDTGSITIVPRRGTLPQSFVSAPSTLSSTPNMPLRLLPPHLPPPPPVPSHSRPIFVPVPSVPSIGATPSRPPSRPLPPRPPSVSASGTSAHSSRGGVESKNKQERSNVSPLMSRE